MEKHRSNIVVILQNTNATPFQRHGDIAYACCLCKNEYLSPKDLKTHTIKSHNDEEYKQICKGKPLRFYLMKLDVTNLTCKICNIVVSSPELLFDHLEIHGKIIHRDIKNRIIPFRFDTDKHTCAICSSVFTKFKLLREHLNIHFRNYICRLCDSGFVNVGMLTSHEERHKIGTYNCGYCDKIFSTKKNKKIHETLLHKDTKKNKRNLTTKDAMERDEVNLIASKLTGQKREIEKHRDNLLAVLENTNATPFGKCTDVGFSCRLCPETFLDPKYLKQHTLKSHNSEDFLIISKPIRVGAYIVKLDITSLTCKICNNSIDSLEELFNHLEFHDKIIHRDVKNHIIPFKFDTEKHICVICSSVFNKFKLLRQHMNVHFSNYVCDICNAGFITDRMRIAHIQCHKTGVFDCSYCPKSFTTRRSKKVHENMVHLNCNYASTCGFCNERFKTYKHKNDHLVAVHGLSPASVDCSACEKTFETQSQLTRHVQRDHLMERPYKCDDCEWRFFSKENLKRHLMKHAGVRNFECNVCMKTFVWRKSLREHMRIHQDDRRFKCDQCGLGFIQKSNWRGHMRRKHNVEINSVL